MRDYLDAKVMARRLRQALDAKGVAVTHSESLELIARSFGFDNWNILAARMGQDADPVKRRDDPPTPEGLMAAVEATSHGSRDVLVRLEAAEAFLSRWSDEHLSDFCKLTEAFPLARGVMARRQRQRADKQPANQP